MHDPVRRWVAKALPAAPVDSIIEIGSYDVNGNIRDLLPPAASYCGIDIREGPGVDVAADAATWQPPELVDLVVCCEVFEHTPDWERITRNVVGWLNPGGWFIGTAAGPGRAAHSAEGLPRIPAGEYYGNVAPPKLSALLGELFVDHAVDVAGTDVRWWAIAED